ncbi:MAG: hypothetical protein VCB42_10335 [Myxococcota bacterium]
MTRNKNKARVSDDAGAAPLCQSRRSFLTSAAAGVACFVGVPGLLRAATHGATAAMLPKATRELLKSSRYVYISPLKSDGEESRCHGEVWYAWIDGAVVVTVASDRWKARALKHGLHGARVWVGDHGRWKGDAGDSAAFREAPGFDARGEIVADDRLLEELLAAYEQKYPKEMGRWRDRMRSGYHDGSRVLIRYVPTRADAHAQ